MKNPISLKCIIKNKKDLQPYDNNFFPLPVIPKGSFGKVVDFAYNILEDTHFFIFKVEFEDGVFVFTDRTIEDIDILTQDEYLTERRIATEIEKEGEDEIKKMYEENV